MSHDYIYGSGASPVPVEVYVTSLVDTSRPAPRSVLRVIDRAEPVIVSGVRSAAEIELKVVTLETTSKDALWLILNAGPVIRFVPANPVDYGVPSTMYLSVGDVTESRVSPNGAEDAREWTIPAIVVAKPAGWQP